MTIEDLRPVSQEEIDKAIIAHEAYLNGKPGAKRMVFNHCDLTGAKIRNRDLRDADFTGSRLERADLSGSNFKSAAFFSSDLRRANLKYCNLSRADMRGALFNGADLTNADLSDADLREGVVARRDKKGGLTQITHVPMAASGCDTIFRGATLTSTKMHGMIAISADFTDAVMRETKLVRAHLKQAILAGADLSFSDLSGANLEGADLHGAIIAGANTAGMDVRGADLSGIVKEPEGEDAKLAQHIANLIDLHILWRKTMGKDGQAGVFDNYDLRAAKELSGQPLTAFRARNSTMCSLDFSGAELQGAVLTGSDMRNCDLKDCDMRGINLSKCNLQRSDFRNSDFSPLILADGREIICDLSCADLSYTDLSGLDLSRAKMMGVNLTGAKLVNTKIPQNAVNTLILGENVEVLQKAS